MSLGTKLKYIRNFRGMTLQELGLALGFPENQAHSRIAQYESEYKTPRMDVILKLATALDVNPDYFIAHEESTLTGFMRILFEIERLYGLDIEITEDDYIFKIDRKSLDAHGPNTSIMEMLLLQNAVKTGQLPEKLYEEWKLQFPNFTRFDVKQSVINEKFESLDTSIDFEEDTNRDPDYLTQDTKKVDL